VEPCNVRQVRTWAVEVEVITGSPLLSHGRQPCCSASHTRHAPQVCVSGTRLSSPKAYLRAILCPHVRVSWLGRLMVGLSLEIRAATDKEPHEPHCGTEPIAMTGRRVPIYPAVTVPPGSPQPLGVLADGQPVWPLRAGRCTRIVGAVSASLPTARLCGRTP
jgi:hypothetical protein